MNRITPLYALLQVAETARDAVQADVLRAAADLRGMQEQHERLGVYRDEYEQRYQQRFATGGTIDIVRCYHSFMARLGQAIDHQTTVVAQGAKRLSGLEQLLQERDMQLASVRKLIERRNREDDAVLARREQRAADEISARVAWRTAASALSQVQ